MEEKIKLRFLIEYGAGCLWPVNALARDKYGVGCLDAAIYDSNGKVNQEPKIKLPIHLTIRTEKLVDLYYSRLDQANPSSPGLWNDSQLSDFLEQTFELYMEIKEHLGPNIEIEYKQE